MKNEMSTIEELTFDEVQHVAGGCLLGNCEFSCYSISGGNGGAGCNGGDVNGIASNVGSGILGVLGSWYVTSHVGRSISNRC